MEPVPPGKPSVDDLVEAAKRAAEAGRRGDARAHLEHALQSLPTDSGPLAAMILRRIGRTYLDDGHLETGREYLQAALAIAESCDDTAQRAHTINVIAISHWQRGDFDEALRLYTEAGELARVAGDDWLVATVELNLGIVASTRGDYDGALGHYAVSLDHYRALGMENHRAHLLNNLGMTHAACERWEEAERMYADAHDSAVRAGDSWMRLMVESNRVALAIARRQYADARAICDRVLDESLALGDTRLLAETYKHRGIIARETNAFGDAEHAFAEALRHATEREDLLAAAETSREQAELFLNLGRNRETLQALSHAHALFGRIRIPHELEDVSRRMRALEGRFYDVVRQWAQSIELKDMYTMGHCERVADFACAIARESGFGDSTMFWFRVGALLHDVGKIAVPVEILTKPGALLPEERRIMERHSVAGAELLANVEFPWDVLPMVRGHHERWDGSGYPDRLAGADIPLSARILCVADVYDALTSDRPYRSGFTRERALQIMTADSGRAFDGQILDRFIRLLERDPGLGRRGRSSGAIAAADFSLLEHEQGAASAPMLS